MPKDYDALHVFPMLFLCLVCPACPYALQCSAQSWQACPKKGV